MKRLLTLAASALALAATPLAAQDVAISGVTVAKGDGSEPIANGAVVIRSGKVVYAGPADQMPAVPMQLVQAPPDTWVTPGLVAAVTSLGLWDVGAVTESNDTSAGKSPFNAALDVTPAINPSSQHIAISRAGGITRALVQGGSAGAIFAGQGAIIDLGADTDAVRVPRAFQKVVLGEAGAQISGGSRTATHVALRNAMIEAQAYANGRWDGADALLTRADAEALGKVISGRQKLLVAADRASDIREVIALKREFPKLDIVLLGANEGWLVAREIAASGIPVIANALVDLPSSFDQLAATQSNIGRMAAAGVKLAINADAMEQPRYLAQFAGNLVGLQNMPGAAGLSWGEALAAITSKPAEIIGLNDAGVLRPGAVGDLVIWDGDPLEVSSAPVQVYIDGVRQPLDNHQTRLRERYRDLDESNLPKAYDW